jgi:spore germination protein YaaH
MSKRQREPSQEHDYDRRHPMETAAAPRGSERPEEYRTQLIILAALGIIAHLISVMAR